MFRLFTQFSSTASSTLNWLKFEEITQKKQDDICLCHRFPFYSTSEIISHVPLTNIMESEDKPWTQDIESGP